MSQKAKAEELKEEPKKTKPFVYPTQEKLKERHHPSRHGDEWTNQRKVCLNCDLDLPKYDPNKD